MTPIVSIIVPIYNMEKYLDNCLKSIVNQSYKNIQVILINDGSKDKSEQIAKKYQENDSRIILINKENSGVSSSRNMGIDLANGKYIIFVDADDYIEPKMIEIMVNEINKSNVGLIQCFFKKVKDDNIKLGDVNKYDKIEYTKQEAIRSIIYRKNTELKLNRAIWGKIYFTDIIKANNIKFKEDIYMFEDGFFNLQYLKYIDNIKILTTELYAYRQTNTSATKKFDENRARQSSLILKNLNQYVKQENINYANDEINLFACEMLSGIIAKQIFNKSNKANYYQKREKLNQIIEEEYLKYINKIDLKKIRGNNRIMIYLIRKRLYALLNILYRLKG